MIYDIYHDVRVILDKKFIEIIILQKNILLDIGINLFRLCCASSFEIKTISSRPFQQDSSIELVTDWNWRVH